MLSHTFFSRSVIANTLLAIFLLSACSSSQDLKTISGTPSGEVDPAEFSQFATYRWHPGNLSEDKKSVPADIDKAIKLAIAETLGTKGFSALSEGPVDFLVSYSVTAKDRVNIHTFNVYEGYAPGFSWRPDHGFQMAEMTQTAATEAIEYREGSLVIDILNPQDNTIIWRGVGRRAIPQAFREIRIKRGIKPAVAAILDNFPPT